VTLRKLWSGWREALVIVTPETVIAWHRQGFRRYWSWISRRGKSRDVATTNAEVRELVRRMSVDNPNWDAP